MNTEQIREFVDEHGAEGLYDLALRRWQYLVTKNYEDHDERAPFIRDCFCVLSEAVDGLEEACSYCLLNIGCSYNPYQRRTCADYDFEKILQYHVDHKEELIQVFETWINDLKVGKKIDVDIERINLINEVVFEKSATEEEIIEEALVSS